MFKFIDLFCGIGGFRVALQKQGMECVFSCDIDKYAQTAYQKNFGDKPYGDVTEIPEDKIPRHEILCAGFPCQPFSISGKKLGTKDIRGRLFYEIIRIAQYHKPLVMILENVKNIMSMDNGEVIKDIRQKLDEIGYNVHINVLNASNFGVPQARERVYFACLRKDTGTSEKLKYSKPKETFKKIYLEDILEKDVPKSMYIDRKDIEITKKIPTNELRPIRIGIVNKGGQGERIYSPKGHAITLSAYGGGVGAKTGLYLDNNGIRRLTITEAKRVMGFSDNHYVSEGMQGYQQLGNAVIPSMIEHVYRAIRIC
ncbi:DNA (cytosine-5-)-methyltransferase [Borreliella burgdorferi]|uniref:Cytosine-specific methyltransferase n=2 Tax=Borreliella burgdorferi TaxID=139 RepID=A0A7U3YB22_BORBG|nr:DNA cytosine methyltransferase [Borreliella burgdorferi]ACL34349.1 cytosine-specific methyltransferase NlaX (M.NlaX) [Borreliella burgdorferi 156a]ACN92742.1 DNA-cytosine methyltransferase [Borreliella burgdorferi 118a]PRQ97326.1 DNA (cytosine-5-)-methyltransferase [Borreliella burgdorferi]PRR06939.1 DNA (cytosine-5-)-methyltransferase [Borreliella burgdorferi]PRR11234.1 DNA (cytosine-5-)-methyltransferase [Borreliella burgdorferi]